MREIGWIRNFLSKEEDALMISDLDFVSEMNQTTYLKELAIEVCSNFIARTISQTDFRHVKKGVRLEATVWDRLLNKRPNSDESAADFWQTVVNKLIRDNEVLIITHDNSQLLVADSFYREEKALYPDTFKNVTVKDFTFTSKTWSMDDVIYLSYNNKSMKSFMNSLAEDYASLFNALINASKRSYQLRGSINFESIQNLDKEKRQSYIDRVLDSVKTSTMAVFPLSKGIEYKEYSNGSVKGPSVEEIEKIKRALIDDVANILGIPVNLVHGDVADLSNAMEVYIKFCINPLLKKIEDELNAKIELGTGEKIELRGITNNNVIDKSEAVDKLVASGAFTRNEVRQMFGFEKADDPELDKYVITKNYETVEDSSKGGENENEEQTNQE